MNRRDLRLAAWPYVAVIACVLLVTGCQDGSGPSAVLSPEGKPAYEGAKPPPAQPSDPAITFIANTRVRGMRQVNSLKVMNADGSHATAIYYPLASIAEHGPSFSRDGHRIAFRKSGDLWLIDVSLVNGVPTGSNARVLLDRTTGISGPAWSPLEDVIAFTDI